VQYAYDEMPSGADESRLASITYPSGYTLTYNYSSGLNSSISRLSSLSDSTGALESYSYLGLGTVVIRSHPQPTIDLTYVKQSGESNGAAGDEYTGLDAFGRIIGQRWINTSTSTATDRFQYTYDRDGNVLTKDNLVNSSFDETYTYDGLNQLATFAQGSSHTQDFNYDSLGNFDSVTTDGGTPQTRSANNQNEITSISGATTPTYDADGNMTGDQTGLTFVYDAWNRMVAVKSGGTTLETFSYDGENRRVTNTISGTTTDLYYSSQWQVLEEQQSGSDVSRYVWSPVYVNAMVLRDRATTTPGTLNERLYSQQDANWNVTALVDGSGSVVERNTFDPYGVTTVYDGSYTVRGGGSSYAWAYNFQGMRFDSISGLDEASERFYSPTLQKWTSVDPAAFAAGDDNLYGFVSENPANYDDPLGLAKVTINMKDWLAEILKKKSPKGLTTPASLKPADIIAWLGTASAKLFNAPGDLIMYLSLLGVRSDATQVTVQIKDKTSLDPVTKKECCVFDGNITYTSTMAKKDEIDLGHVFSLAHLFPGLGKLDVGNIGREVSLKIAEGSVDATASPPTAKFTLEMNIVANATVVKKEESFELEGTLYCGKDKEYSYANRTDMTDFFEHDPPIVRN
jgi:RHS repeat-associated protein